MRRTDQRRAAVWALYQSDLLGRPLGHLIDRGDSVVEEDEDDQPYQLQLICRPKSEKYARAQIVQRTGGGGDRLVLRGIHTGRTGDDSVALCADQGKVCFCRNPPASAAMTTTGISFRCTWCGKSRWPAI